MTDTLAPAAAASAGAVPAVSTVPSSPAAPEVPALDAHALRTDFPILGERPHGKPLVYLDSAATSQKPLPVIEAMDAYYRGYNANVHRGIYEISEKATAAYEGAREQVARFVNAPSAREIVWVRNATEAINLVAYSWGRRHLGQGDAIVLTEMEHHANLVRGRSSPRRRTRISSSSRSPTTGCCARTCSRCCFG